MNLAARLEAANRELGTTICVDEATAAACCDLTFRSLGTVMAEDFSTPVAIFTPAILTKENGNAQHANDLA
jgi:adenylate cyclase